MLPQNTALEDLADYFQAILTKNTVLRRDLQIKKSLMRSQSQIVHEEFIRARSRKVQIDSDRSCGVCNKRIGNSVFACYPNNTVVHFICCKVRMEKMRIVNFRFDSFAHNPQTHITTTTTSRTSKSIQSLGETFGTNNASTVLFVDQILPSKEWCGSSIFEQKRMEMKRNVRRKRS